MTTTETFKTVHDVPTKVVCIGPSVDQDLKRVEYLVLVFPGNPGVIDYYKEFMMEVYESLGKRYPETTIPVWGISHAGHQFHPEECPSHSFPPFKGNKHLYNLQGQFKHKLEFTAKFVPQHIKIIGVGHSIGCKTWAEVLKNDSSKISQLFMLFPTLERMRETPNGKSLVARNVYRPYLQPFLRVIMALPTPFHRLLLKAYFWGQKRSIEAEEASLHLFQYPNFERIVHMGECEMEEVRDLDVPTLEPHLDKIFFYFGASDDWMPLAYVEEMRERLPRMKYQVCDQGLPHAFVVNHSIPMAATVVDLIKLEERRDAVKTEK